MSIRKGHRDSQRVPSVDPEVGHSLEGKGYMSELNRSWGGNLGEALRLHGARAHRHVGGAAEGLGHSPYTRRRSPHFLETSAVLAGMLEEQGRNEVHGRARYDAWMIADGWVPHGVLQQSVYVGLTSGVARRSLMARFLPPGIARSSYLPPPRVDLSMRDYQRVTVERFELPCL